MTALPSAYDQTAAPAVPADGRDRIVDILYLGAAVNPDGVALQPTNGEPVHFGALVARVERLAMRFLEMGLRPGGRAAIVGENGSCGIAALFAASLCGGVVVPVNARFTAFEVAHIEREVGFDLVIYDAEESGPAASHALAAGAEPLVVEGLGTLRVHRPERTPEREEFAPGTALVLFTSGSTGSPKGVMHAARAITWVAACDRRFRDIRPQDRIFCPLPLAHMFGLSGLLMPYLSGGASVELGGRFDANRVLARLAAGGVTHFFGVPGMYAALLDSAERTGLRPTGVICARTGGSALDPTLAERAAGLFGVELANGYGASEISPICTTNGRRSATVGKPAAGAEVRIVAAGRDAAPGETGEVWARGPHMMLGYHRAASATTAVLRPDGWYATGDLGAFDQDGNLTIVGRAKDVINRSGFNVYPAEVETALAAHGAVARCAVIGVPKGPGDEEVVAVVEPRSGRGLTEDALRRHAGGRLAGYKRPARYVFVDNLPVGPTGKVVKSELMTLART